MTIFALKASKHLGRIVPFRPGPCRSRLSEGMKGRDWPTPSHRSRLTDRTAVPLLPKQGADQFKRRFLRRFVIIALHSQGLANEIQFLGFLVMGLKAIKADARGGLPMKPSGKTAEGRPFAKNVG